MQQRLGKTFELTSRTDEMLELVEKYSSFIPAESRFRPKAPKSGGKVVVLTGATGTLGAHILHNLCADSSVSSIICLIRAIDGEAPKLRVLKSLGKRKLSALGLCDDRVQCVPCCLHELDLGLTEDVIRLVRDRATHFIHVRIIK